MVYGGPQWPYYYIEEIKKEDSVFAYKVYMSECAVWQLICK